MRACKSCGKEDRPFWESQPCNCGAPQDDDPSPLKHRPDCHAIGHEVVMYPVRITKDDLTWDKKLPASLARSGWEFFQNGPKMYRRKLMCRDCIEKYKTTESMRRDYEKACRAARGVDDMTYAQLLARQSY